MLKNEKKIQTNFIEIRKSKLKIIKSWGFIPPYNNILKSPLKEIIDEEFYDQRN